ncbi:MAG: hypothetical protein ACYCT1_08250 [Steroidobacteraceae bacterium]
MTSGGWIKHEIQAGERAAEEVLADFRKGVAALEKEIGLGAKTATVTTTPAGHVVVRAEHEDAPAENTAAGGGAEAADPKPTVPGGGPTT